MDSGWDHRALPRWDCSIRIHPDQRLLTAPRTLSWSTTSFFGCWRQGIHTYALCSLTYIGSSKSTTAAASRLTSSGARLTYLRRYASPRPVWARPGIVSRYSISRIVVPGVSALANLAACFTLLGSPRFVARATHRGQLFWIILRITFAAHRSLRCASRLLISLGFALLCSCQGTQGLNPDDWTA